MHLAQPSLGLHTWGQRIRPFSSSLPQGGINGVGLSGVYAVRDHVVVVAGHRAVKGCHRPERVPPVLGADVVVVVVGKGMAVVCAKKIYRCAGADGGREIKVNQNASTRSIKNLRSIVDAKFMSCTFHFADLIYGNGLERKKFWEEIKKRGGEIAEWFSPLHEIIPLSRADFQKFLQFIFGCWSGCFGLGETYICR